MSQNNLAPILFTVLKLNLKFMMKAAIDADLQRRPLILTSFYHGSFQHHVLNSVAYKIIFISKVKMLPISLGIRF